jgi:F-type H+-transporting ATPase subunit delta
MKITKQARRDGKQLFRGCIVDGLMDEGRVRQTVQQVIALKPRGYLGMLSHFQRLVKLDIDRRTARVENAVASTPELMAQVRASLESRYGRGLSVSFSVNHELIGGLRVKVGSDVFDGSIQARLKDLSEGF